MSSSDLEREILNFLDTVIDSFPQYTATVPEEEEPRDMLGLMFTKTVNDCKAILLLMDNFMFLQAAIVARSTMDACGLMMDVAFHGESSSLLSKWTREECIGHWSIINAIDNGGHEPLDRKSYTKLRKELDDVVHCNYRAMRLYPYQAGQYPEIPHEIMKGLCDWSRLFELFLVSCLLAATLLDESRTHRIECYLARLGHDMPGG